MTRRPTILFVCYGAGHVNMLIPVIKHLQQHDNGYRLVVLGLTTAKFTLNSAGIESLGFLDFVDSCLDEKALGYGRELTANLPDGPVSRDESVAYHGISFAEIVEDLGEEEAGRLYRELGRQSFCPIRFLQRVMEQVKPDLLVSTNSPRAEKAAFFAAREMKIPSLCLVDLFGLREIEWIKTPGYATRICVLADQVRSAFIEAGIASERVVVTGNPVFDRLCDPDLPDRGRRLKKQKGWDGKKVLLWASQPEPSVHPFTGEAGDPELPRKIDQELETFGRDNPDWQLVIRFHPNEYPVKMSEIWEVSTQDDSLYELLALCDIIVTMSSTVGLEGYLLGKKVVQICTSIFSPDAPFAKLGMASRVDDLSQLGSQILTARIPELAGTREESATELIARQINSVLEEPLK
ncbi:MAG: hypothetical protein P1V20_15795 [Verrucomicrobiales bacterium]|nr:hypothetical protein [Verrucomicrobiales bacterium]